MTDAYERHLAQEAEDDGIHPDGCYWCGRDHPSQDCRSDERELARQEGDSDA